MKHRARSYLYIGLTVLMMVLIFVHSSLPANLSQMESDFLSDFLARLFHWDPEFASFIVRKTAHFLEYAILGVLLGLTVREFWKGKNRTGQTDKESTNPLRPILIIIPWAIGTFYAVTDEFHQSFVEGRSCELRDMAIDTGGVLIGVLIILIICYNCFDKKTKMK